MGDRDEEKNEEEIEDNLKNESKSRTELDPIQSAIGDFGRWQLIICFSLSLIKIPVAWHQLVIIFLSPPVDHWCVGAVDTELQGSNISWGLEDCKKNFRMACTNWKYDTQIFSSTIISEWDLICDREQLANVAQLVYMFGVLIGNVVFGMLADEYGRKTPMIASIALQIVAGVATSYVKHYYLFLMLRFADALATGGMMITSFVICMEIVGQKWRAIVSTLYHLPFNIGHSTLPALSYLFRDWRILQLAISLPPILCLSYWIFIPESPRWLLAVGREEEAKAILVKARAKNKRTKTDLADCLDIHSKQLESKKTERKATILDLFRSPTLRINTLCIYYNWLVCGLCFFGLAQYIGRIGGDIFVNVAISGLIEMPGSICCFYFMDKFGRRYTLATAQMVAGLSCLFIMAVPKGENWAEVILSAVGIIGMSLSFPTVYLFSGEIFPTVVRNVGVGSASMCARIGSMIAPFITTLESSSKFLPPLVFGIVPLIGSLLCFLLPETAHCVLPDTIEEGENFGKKKKELEGIVNENFQLDEDATDVTHV